MRRIFIEKFWRICDKNGGKKEEFFFVMKWDFFEI
jgi:hypothetical protein